MVKGLYVSRPAVTRMRNGGRVWRSRTLGTASIRAPAAFAWAAARTLERQAREARQFRKLREHQVRRVRARAPGGPPISNPPPTTRIIREAYAPNGMRLELRVMPAPASDAAGTVRPRSGLRLPPKGPVAIVRRGARPGERSRGPSEWHVTTRRQRR